MEEAFVATPEANLIEKTLDKAGDVVEQVLTLPAEELIVVKDQVAELQGRLLAIGVVELLLVIAVIYLLWKSFKK